VSAFYKHAEVGIASYPDFHFTHASNTSYSP